MRRSINLILIAVVVMVGMGCGATSEQICKDIPPDWLEHANGSAWTSGPCVYAVGSAVFKTTVSMNLAKSTAQARARSKMAKFMANNSDVDMYFSSELIAHIGYEGEVAIYYSLMQAEVRTIIQK